MRVSVLILAAPLVGLFRCNRGSQKGGRSRAAETKASCNWVIELFDRLDPGTRCESVAVLCRWKYEYCR